MLILQIKILQKYMFLLEWTFLEFVPKVVNTHLFLKHHSV